MIAERPRAAARGFTLLEVLIALLVIALALAALIRAAGLEARAQAQLEQASLAQWVAANAIAEVRLAETFPPVGRRSGSERLAGRDFDWTLEVSATDALDIRRLEVTVTEGENRTPAGSLTGFAVSP